MGLSLVNKLKASVLNRGDNQQEEDGIDTVGDTLNGKGDGNGCGEKYNSERKQLILSPTELEDNV